MKTFVRVTLVLLIAFFTLPVLAASVSIKYAGSGYDTTVDNFSDGAPVGLYQAAAKGSFGAKSVQISADFAPADVGCPDGYAIEANVAYSAWVLTFAKYDQLFGISTEGWICVSLVTGHYFGEGFGAFIGGTDRFAEATGEFMIEYSGFNLDPPVGFRSLEGTLTGDVYGVKAEKPKDDDDESDD